MTDRARLACGASTLDGGDEVELLVILGQEQRLPDDHLEHVVAEVLLERPSIDCRLTVAGPKIDARGRSLAPSGSVVGEFAHGETS